jgi:hypothetical protein
VGPTDLFRSWTLSNVAQPLPVQLVHLAVLCTDEARQVEWTTASESGSSHFQVWRSTEHGTEQMIGAVPSAGHSNTLRTYGLLDPDPPSGALLYRLESIDLDGTSGMSDQVYSACEHLGGPSITGSYTEGGIHLRYHLPYAGHTGWALYNAAGQLVATWPTMELLSGDQQLTLPLRGSSTGLYTLRALDLNMGSALRLLVP